MLETVKKTLFVINRLGFAGMLICLGIEVAPEHPAAAIVIYILSCVMAIYSLKYKGYTRTKTLPFGNPIFDVALMMLAILDIMQNGYSLFNTFGLVILFEDIIYWMVLHYSCDTELETEQEI